MINATLFIYTRMLLFGFIISVNGTNYTTPYLTYRSVLKITSLALILHVLRYLHLMYFSIRLIVVPSVLAMQCAPLNTMPYFTFLSGTSKKRRKEETTGKNVKRPQHELDHYGLVPLPVKVCYTCTRYRSPSTVTSGKNRP